MGIGLGVGVGVGIGGVIGICIVYHSIVIV